MVEKLIKPSIESIPVPEEEVTNAIRSGIRKGKSRQSPISNRVKGLAIVAACMVVVGVGGFLVPSVGQVLADIPVVGKLYQSFDDQYGGKLTKDGQELATDKNEQFSLHVLGSYYDASRIGIVYQVVDNKTGDGMSINSLYPTISEINGQPIKGEVIPSLKQNDEHKNVYDGYFLINLTEQNLSKQLTIPLEIATPAGKLTTDISLKQLPTNGKSLDISQTIKHEQGIYQATITHITKGREVSLIDYKVSQPKGSGVGAAWANFQLFTKDQQQEYIVPKELSGALIKQYTTKTEDVAEYRAIIPNNFSDNDLDLDYANLHVNIEVANALEDPIVVGLKKPVPQTFGKKNNPYQVTIEKIEQTKDQVTIALQFPQLPEAYGKEQLAHSLTDNFHIGTKHYLEETASGKFDDLEHPELFYIKYGKINQLEYQTGQGWQANLTYDIADTHGWGKYFDSATFDENRAYFGGSLRPSSISFEPMTINLEK